MRFAPLINMNLLRRKLMALKCWFAVVLVTCSGVLGANMSAWGTQDPEAPDEEAGEPGGYGEMAEYMGFGFRSEGAILPLLEYVKEVSSAYVSYKEAEGESGVTSTVLGIEEVYSTKEREARAALKEGLEGLKQKAQKRVDAPLLSRMHDLLQRVQGGEAVPPVRFLCGKKPKKRDASFGGHYYRLFSAKEELCTWHVAAQRCEELGGYLACIETQEEWAFLSERCIKEDPEKEWLLGATDEVEEGSFRWINGAPVGKEVWWNKDEPDNEAHPGPAHYAVLANYGYGWGLSDNRAGIRTAFVCEWGSGLAFGWDAGLPGASRLIQNYWAVVTKAEDLREKSWAALKKSLRRPRVQYERGLGAATTKLVKALEAQMRSATRAGEVHETRRLTDAINGLHGIEFFPLRPLAASRVDRDAIAFCGSHYKVMEDPLPWHMARDRCRELGGRLVVVNSDEKAALLIPLFRSNRGNGLWVGATDELEEGTWIWEDGSIGLPVKFSREDNADDTEHALLLSGGDSVIWDFPAGRRMRFICEWPGYW